MHDANNRETEIAETVSKNDNQTAAAIPPLDVTTVKISPKKTQQVNRYNSKRKTLDYLFFFFFLFVGSENSHKNKKNPCLFLTIKCNFFLFLSHCHRHFCGFFKKK